MYEQVRNEESLTQGLIIDDCPLVSLPDRFGQESGGSAPIFGRVRVLILTQACDLIQTGRTTKAIVAVLSEARDLVEKKILKPQMISDNIRGHQVFGWYFLPAAQSPVIFPESILDLRELHTVQRSILERLIAEGKGVCRLATPYREHLAQHFAVTYMRIGLPEPYPTEP